MGELMRITPTEEELRDAMREFFGPTGVSLYEAPPWIVANIHGVVSLVLKESFRQIEVEGEIDLLKVIGSMVDKALQWAFFIGALAERRGWDTDIRAVEPQRKED